jgi:hypothetical protein
MITGTVGLRGEVPITPTYELFEQLGTEALSNMIDRSDEDVVALVREEYVVRLKPDPPHPGTNSSLPAPMSGKSQIRSNVFAKPDW